MLIKKLSLILLLLCSALSPLVVTAASSSTLTLDLGQPTYMQKLYYQQKAATMKSPYVVIYYYAGGIYKLIGPGFDHYGTYMIEGQFGQPNYVIHYISFPSADWGNTSGYFVLNYDNSTHRFTQSTILSNDKPVVDEFGCFSEAKNTIASPASLKWQASMSTDFINKCPP